MSDQLDTVTLVVSGFGYQITHVATGRGQRGHR